MEKNFAECPNLGHSANEKNLFLTPSRRALALSPHGPHPFSLRRVRTPPPLLRARARAAPHLPLGVGASPPSPPPSLAPLRPALPSPLAGVARPPLLPRQRSPPSPLPLSAWRRSPLPLPTRRCTSLPPPPPPPDLAPARADPATVEHGRWDPALARAQADRSGTRPSSPGAAALPLPLLRGVHLPPSSTASTRSGPGAGGSGDGGNTGRPDPAPARADGSGARAPPLPARRCSPCLSLCGGAAPSLLHRLHQIRPPALADPAMVAHGEAGSSPGAGGRIWRAALLSRRGGALPSPSPSAAAPSPSLFPAVVPSPLPLSAWRRSPCLSLSRWRFSTASTRSGPSVVAAWAWWRCGVVAAR
ncbi:vegetative cell wall protein gp1-like [Miscanthus floridulus]|uniref:vegetative cell wall protein gp1-like n=1 Tax=Miscanthus floridulus TaxID=154761 RepID=UPI00345933D0